MYGLKRLGRLACSILCFRATRDGVLGDDSGELGTLEYEDGEQPISALAARWRCSGMVMDVGVFSIATDRSRGVSAAK